MNKHTTEPQAAVPFVVIDQYGIENAEGKFESVIVKECETKRAALKIAREYLAINPDANVLINRGHSQRFEDMLTYVYVDDAGKIKTEAA
jgi:hypothetical protein